MKRPLLALDLDGVVVDLTPEIFRRMKQVGLPIPPWKEPSSFHWTKKSTGLSKEIISYVIGLYGDPTLYVDAKPVDGAIEGILSLREQGWLIMAVTSRKAHTGGVTHQWLEDHGIKNMPVLLAGKDKATWVKQYRCDAAVDDAPHHLEAYRDRGIDGIVFDHLYNRDVTGLDRVQNWTELIDMLSIRVEGSA